MPVYLADSSIWIATARRRHQYLVDLFRRRTESDEVVTCIPVALEVLAGHLNTREYQREWTTVWEPLTWLPLREEAMQRALEVQRGLIGTPKARRRRAMDHLIAACAEDAGGDVVLWHWDADLTAICEHTGQPHEPEHERSREHGLD